MASWHLGVERYLFTISLRWQVLHRTKLVGIQWADGVLDDLLDVPYHHLVLSPPWQLRPMIAFNQEVGLNLLARAELELQLARRLQPKPIGLPTKNTSKVTNT